VIFRRKLLYKYLYYLIGLVTVALLVSGAVSVYFTYQETKHALLELQREKARGAASSIRQFVLEIERQLGWMRLPQVEPPTPEQRRIDYLKLLRQVPAISDVTYADVNGRERQHVFRLSVDSAEAGADLSADPKYTMTRGGKTFFSPVYFRKDTEPYMTIALPGNGLTVAEVNLKFIWDVVSQIKIGSRGLAYVVDASGQLIAHPDINLVLRKSDFSRLSQVAAAHDLLAGISDQVAIAPGFDGKEMLTAFAVIPELGWTVFVEQPLDEAFLPLYASLWRSGLLLLVGLALATGVSVLLARRMVVPIRALQLGAARIGAGDLRQRIMVSTGDEIEALAKQINNMALQLDESYAGLERKVDERTMELSKERERSEALLRNILPAAIAEELKDHGFSAPRRHDEVSILFSDFVAFTQTVSTVPPQRMVGELNEIFSGFDEIVERHKLEKIKTIGDAYMAAAGVPEALTDHAIRSVSAALEMQQWIAARNVSSSMKWGLRIGIHAGPVVSGVVGSRKYAYDIWGDTVNIASRMESSGEPGRVNISAYVYDLVRGVFDCEYRGKVAAKGKGEIDMYFVDALKNTC
jgi:class 3 adenylate cyclase